MKTIKAKRTTVDMETGNVLEEKQVEMGVILPDIPPGGCEVCGFVHKKENPHNLQTWRYQYSFFGAHGRWPTWEDAMRHCSTEIQQLWKVALREKGIKI